MKNIYFIKTESYPDSLFVYPCKDSNGNHLANRTVAIFGGENTVKAEWFTGHGALTVVNPDDEEMAKAEVAVVMPNYGRSYYEVLDYYFQILQKLVRSMKEKQGFRHITVILPPKSDEYSAEMPDIAHYAICGLVKGLGKMYASSGLFVNGIILNGDDPAKYLQERVLYLSSDNSCNMVGQIFKL